MIVTPDFLAAAAGLLSKDLIVETEDSYFLTPKGLRAAKEKLLAMGNEDHLLLIIYFLDRREEDGHEPNTEHQG